MFHIAQVSRGEDRNSRKVSDKVVYGAHGFGGAGGGHTFRALYFVGGCSLSCLE